VSGGNAPVYSALDEGVQSGLLSKHFIHMERATNIHGIGGQSLPRASLNVMAKRKILFRAGNQTLAIQTVAYHLAD
jgi:hypothetical protein